MFVCVSVCLCVCGCGYVWNHMRDLNQFFLHIAYVRGSVLLLYVDGRLMIGHVACCREPGDGSAHCGQSVINNCVL